jgi:exonuclease III
MPVHNKLVKILNWNANGILVRKEELLDLLETESFDIALINETHLREKNTLKLANLKVYRTDRPGDTSHGGTAVIVRATITHEEIPLPKLMNLEATGVKVKTPWRASRFRRIFSTQQPTSTRRHQCAARILATYHHSRRLERQALGVEQPIQKHQGNTTAATFHDSRLHCLRAHHGHRPPGSNLGPPESKADMALRSMLQHQFGGTKTSHRTRCVAVFKQEIIDSL